MITAILGLLSALLALVPVVMNVREEKKGRVHALRKRNLDELHAADGLMFHNSTMPP